jgi:hypothetical protein
MNGELLTPHFDLLLKRYVMPKTIMVIFKMTIERVEVVSKKLFNMF